MSMHFITASRRRTVTAIAISAVLPLMSVIISGAFSGCETNPATGENEFILLSTEDQRQLGAQANQEIQAQYGVYDDVVLQSWIDTLGASVVAQSGDTRFDYQFFILDTEVINAFALPGGYIYVTRGLLAYLNNDAQIALVLGHEVGHVAANHSAKQYTNQVLANVGLVIGGALFEDIRPFLGAAQTGLQLLFLSYSRDNESQADTLGVMYATRAGYKAAEGAEFFHTLERLQDQSGNVIPTWASTHPDPTDRQQTILEKAAEWSVAVGGNLHGANPEVYIPRLENLVFGHNPRHGFVDSTANVFYHPDLRFQFPVPSQWSVANFASQVQIISPDGLGVMLLTTSNQLTPAAASNEFKQSGGVQVLDEQFGTVSGFDAVRLRSNVQTDNATLGVLSYFIAKDQTVYVFHGYSDASRFGTYLNTFDNTFSGFSDLNDPTILGVQPYLVDAFQALQSAPFSALVTPNSGANMDVESLAILNQVETGSTIPAGTFLKEVN
jgi:predicted Zn-dependent protease